VLTTASISQQLTSFACRDRVPSTRDEQFAALSSSLVVEVRSYALGPQGTNIERVARRFNHRMNIAHKASIVLCETPEHAVVASRRTTQHGVLAIFWTCAVYFKENELFFRNPDTLPFLFQETFPLDEMQLACRPEITRTLEEVPMWKWRVLTHRSPAPLLAPLPCQVLFANSNAEAAVRCRAGEAEACITTETARELYGLVKLHTFGSPPMVFFGGVCQNGAVLLRQALASMSDRTTIAQFAGTSKPDNNPSITTHTSI